VRLGAAALLLPLACLAQQPHEQEVQRALIERDRRSADFSRFTEPSNYGQLPPHVGQPLSPDPEIARQLRPYERMRMAEQERGFVLQLPPPAKQQTKEPSLKPLPLPRREESVVDPVDLPRPRD
jgi:hypothetical protein